jgi:hypothetical protein
MVPSLRSHNNRNGNDKDDVLLLDRVMKKHMGNFPEVGFVSQQYFLHMVTSNHLI